MSVLTDEHVPSVFVTTLRSNGYDVLEARDVLGEATDDEHLLTYCGENEHVLVTLDRILSQYPASELSNELVWLDQWYR